MFEFRVTKYDPSLRDSRGAFIGDEWTSFDDIGKPFSGVLLAEGDYDRVEDAYAATATAFMGEAGVSLLSVVGLENRAGVRLSFGEGSALDLQRAGEVVRRLLRGEYWCRLEAAGGFIHVGWDYYMYVGVQSPCPAASAAAKQLGLFVEPYRSPYSFMW